MMRKLMLAASAILLTTVLGLAIGQQKPEQKAEDNPTNADKKAAKMITGEVVTVDATKKEITIKDDAGMETRLLVASSTKLTKAGKSITLADVKTGDKISTECAESSDGCKAKSIEVMPPSPSQ